ncbi:hypothetical protein SAMN05444277_101379 [Parafilimonas terrae]|uniref:Uncharacterized protein n=1 Tax=Parafilimonas terrae TaxID=1465490 RepID=A0A1I5RRN8_9BACT|nr:hypothetical protein SAMN05444277_101379 [Parafilimonas terrae]
MNNNFLIKTLVKYFGETKTIKMLNLVHRRSINKRARKYKALLKGI